MLNKKKIEDIIDYALYCGCSFVEVFIEKNKRKSIDISDDVITHFRSNDSYGIGVRIYAKSKYTYISTNDTSEKNLFSIIKEVTNSECTSSVNRKQFFLLDQKDTHVSLKNILNEDDIEERLIHTTNKVKLFSPLIVDAVGTYYRENQDVLIANSNGLFVEDNRDRVRLTFEAYASEGINHYSSSFSCGARADQSMFSDVDFEAECLDVAETAIKFLNATYAPSGALPVVIDNGLGAIIFHEACGHSLEGSFVLNNESIFSDKLNTRISNENITLVDDGALSNAWGTAAFDDEGNPTKENVLIENGILKSFLLDDITSKKLKMENTNSCRRESYKFPPAPRMSNTYIKNGTANREDIISSVDYGVLVKGIAGGAANPMNGNFEFTSHENYLIEKGKIVKPIRTITLSGNGCDVLNKVELVGDNLKFSEGYCGSISGNIPITVGQPTIKISELNVGAD